MAKTTTKKKPAKKEQLDPRQTDFLNYYLDSRSES